MKLRAFAGWAGLMILMASPFTMADSSGPVAAGAKLETLSHEFAFAEGLTCDAKGNVFFTDQPNNRIMEWTVDGKLRTFMQPAGRANGMHFDGKGQLLVCADEKNELWSVTPEAKVSVVLDRFEDNRLNGPNDLWVRPDQALYFTDPFYQRAWWTHQSQPQPGQHVYFLSSDRKTLRQVTTDLKKPNGIVGTPDGKTLYVGDIDLNQTFRFRVAQDGTLSDKTLFCELGSDGMTLDRDGNLYLTGNGVTMYDSAAKKIGHIDVPEEWVGNICFGGADRRTLFIAASKGLYSIRMAVAGANPAK